ncbi:uncharacterized protein LOC133287539 [Gastrolobium bilobum]|uniref:uncharacterized protein LOC133287539 n=1 Tax=Gastrolobium bilobum TaxID=150636 RepID=UPI002AB104A9|nr:uncharacterized protein LOC133287539 [Gastrolobium bilobum]
MELGRGYRSKMNKHHLHGGGISLNSDTVFVIKIPDARFLRIVSRSVFLAMALATLPFLGSILKGFSPSLGTVDSGFDATASGNINAEVLNSILHDLGEEGLLKKEDKALIVSPPHGFEGVAMLNLNSEVYVAMDSDLERRSSFPDESYDFVFAPRFEDAMFADRILRINGILAFPLSSNPSNVGLRKQSNYRVVYLRRYDSIIVAMRKIGLANNLVDSSPKRKLCQFATEAKTTALKGLEDVLLEPPKQQAFAKSNKNLKIKYLPEVLGDSLEGYKRRVFIGVGLPEENKGAIEWFERNYPKKSAKFEIQSLLDAPEDPVVFHTDVSDWVSKHVKEEEYVVMKAEADVVEEMMKKRTICLVDELFLECNNEWWQAGKRKKSGRAYWECVALYGKLRDEGVAVHQWWGLN